MFPAKTTKDLLRYIFELYTCPGVGFEMVRQPNNELLLKRLCPPDVHDFSVLSSSCSHKKISIEDFYPRLKDIFESAIKLKTIGQYINLDIQEKQSEIKKNIQENLIQNPFKVLMDDSLSKKDKLKRRKVFHKMGNCIGFEVANENFLFLSDENANSFFCVIENKNAIIKAVLPSQKNAHNILSQDTSLFFQFMETCRQVAKYYQVQKEPYTQKNWQNFIVNYAFNNAQKNYQEIINPLIMHLVDNTRRFLVDTLLEEHAREIGNSKQEIKTKLKKEKNLIYSLAEKYGYIPKAIPFINCEEIRNSCAHLRPNKNTYSLLEQLSSLYQNFVFGFIDENFLRSYYKQFPLLFPLTDLGKLQEDNFIVNDAESLTQLMDILIPENLKKKGKKEKLEYLKSKGFLKPEETQELSDLFLERNAIAHGQADKEKNRKLSSQISAIQHALICRQKYL